MTRPQARGQPPAMRRVGRLAGRFSLGLLALGTTVLSFGLAVGIGARLEGRNSVGGETTVVRGTAPPGTDDPGPAAGPLKSDVAAPASAAALRNFHAALAELPAGGRNRPVTVLHLGDAHVSGDRLDAHLRSLLQNRFGDAGRSLLLPAGVVKGHRTRGLRFEASGGWSTASALEPSTAVLGLTGVQATATSPQAEMSVTAVEGRFDSVEVAFLSGPDKGAATISVDGRPHAVVTRTAEIGVQRARLPTGGVSVGIKPSGTGPITVLSWSLHKSRPGIRYAALGLPGGGIDVIERLDELVLIDDLRALRPDLIIIGFGGAEAQDDRLDVARYGERYAGLLRLFKRLSPEASFVVLGPPDANRVPEFAARLRGSATTACRALSPQELQEYDALLAAGDDRLARWYPPPRLDDIRMILQRAAASHGAFYWDWSRIMGGACGMHAWVHGKPELALPDHILLTDEGYQRSARALFTDILQGFAAVQAPANRQASQR
jgi:lysophospholipase L1-like esterase